MALFGTSSSGHGTNYSRKCRPVRSNGHLTEIHVIHNVDANTMRYYQCLAFRSHRLGTQSQQRAPHRAEVRAPTLTGTAWAFDFEDLLPIGLDDIQHLAKGHFAKCSLGRTEPRHEMTMT